ncbi:MAG: hypothetical protein AAB930_00875, partial [Patescibacteria group bacterium]
MIGWLKEKMSPRRPQTLVGSPVGAATAVAVLTKDEDEMMNFVFERMAKGLMSEGDLVKHLMGLRESDVM